MTIKLNPLIPELSVSNLEKSLKFYFQVLGFSIAYQRKEEGFAFLMLENAQIMLDEIGKGRSWQTADLDYPLGRGINIQITVKSLDPLVDKLKLQNIKLFLDVEEKKYQQGEHEIVQKQFLVMDPDGYLLRFVEPVFHTY